ncbi:MAG: class I SAM-dependent RNA methyltransferase [Pseudomonadota bacterium]
MPPGPRHTALMLEMFLAGPPGAEPVILAEAREHGFADLVATPGGVEFSGPLSEAWRANLLLRCPTRVLIRLARFPAAHLAQLDRRARRLPWGALLRADVPVVVTATTRASRIYHQGAAAQRLETALAETLGAPVVGTSEPADDPAAISVLLRIERNLCTVSIDASGAPLHRRGFKLAVGKAPLRETLAAILLRQAGFDGSEPVVDPMCGSGTLVLEAAEIACGLAPGRHRAFAFERLAGFDAEAWEAIRDAAMPREPEHAPRYHGSDRDAGVVDMARANAERAGLADHATFAQRAIRDAQPPDGPSGLVIVNPPYGDRIGDKTALRGLYGALGRTLTERFSGWRAAVVTSEPALAQAMGLPLERPPPPLPHGPLRIRLHRTGVIA